tara:strand:- start:835 stop:1086 length:252 start_codon:yes stop_codon:yes gene_type:complete
LSDNLKDAKKARESQFTERQLSSGELADKLVNQNDIKQLAISSLLKDSPVSIDDKLTTLKAAHHVDRERFQNAFRIFMGDTKS